MIIAWVMSLIVMVSSITGYLEHSAALKMRLLALETAAHRHFVATEKTLATCELHVPNLDSQFEAMTTQHGDDALCEYRLLDHDATGKLIRVRAGVGSDSGTQAQLESMMYCDLRDHCSTRASWRWVAPALQRQ